MISTFQVRQRERSGLSKVRLRDLKSCFFPSAPLVVATDYSWTLHKDVRPSEVCSLALALSQGKSDPPPLPPDTLFPPPALLFFSQLFNDPTLPQAMKLKQGPLSYSSPSPGPGTLTSESCCDWLLHCCSPNEVCLSIYGWK